MFLYECVSDNRKLIRDLEVGEIGRSQSTIVVI